VQNLPRHAHFVRSCGAARILEQRLTLLESMGGKTRTETRGKDVPRLTDCCDSAHNKSRRPISGRSRGAAGFLITAVCFGAKSDSLIARTRRLQGPQWLPQTQTKLWHSDSTTTLLSAGYSRAPMPITAVKRFQRSRPQRARRKSGEDCNGAAHFALLPPLTRYRPV